MTSSFASNGNGGGSQTVFNAPLCVATTASTCKAGDIVYTSSGAQTNPNGNGIGYPTLNSTLQLSLMIDLYDAVYIDGASGTSTSGQILSIPYLFAIIGAPGAAIHLTNQATASNRPFNASLLFGSDKSQLK